MSWLLLWLAALAAPPTAFAPPADAPRPTDPGDGVRAVRAAVPVHLDRALRTTFRAEPAELTDAWVLVVEVDPELARPRQAWAPVLYADDAPVELLHRTPDARCLVVVAPRVPLEAVTLYWGSTELPERVTATRGHAELAAARAAGLRPLGARAPAAAPELRLPSEDDLDALARALEARCP